MESNLRPLTLGEILDRTAQLYRTNFLLLAGIAAVYAGVGMVLNLLDIGLSEMLTALHQGMRLHWTVQVFSGVALVVIVLFGNVAGAANNRAVAWVHLGEPATIGGAYRGIVSRLGRYLWLGCLKFLFAWTPLAVLYGGFVGTYLYYVARGVLPQPGAPPAAAPAGGDPAMIVFGVVTIAFGLLFFPAFIYGTFMSLRYALAVPASVVENLRARNAIRRSIELTKGARGRIFVLFLLVGVIETGFLALTQGFFIVYALRHQANVPVALRILQQIVFFITNSFVAPIPATGLTVFYYDQRVRKEGFDIEWMMQAAGLTAPGPVAALAAPGEVDGVAPELEPSEPAMPDADSAHE